MRQAIRDELLSLRDEAYKEFQEKLIPGNRTIIGVRLPELRNLAKRIVKEGKALEEISSYEGEYEDLFFEETMLRAMIIGYVSKKIPPEKTFQLLDDFVPEVDSWAICDSLCSGLKFAIKNQKATWDFISKYMYSDKEFDVRVAVILMMDIFVRYDDDGNRIYRNRNISIKSLQEPSVCNSYFPLILDYVDNEFDQGYYTKMGVAWLIAESFIYHPMETMNRIKTIKKLDKWTYNKALQKIIESHNPDSEIKDMIRALKKDK